MIVVDANLILALSCRGDNTARAFEILEKDAEWIAPPIWESELRNALLKLMRGGKIGIQTANAATIFAAQTVKTFPVSSAMVLRIAETYGLTAYDAEYAALSEWMEIPAVSYDGDLTDAGLATHPDRF